MAELSAWSLLIFAIIDYFIASRVSPVCCDQPGGRGLRADPVGHHPPAVKSLGTMLGSRTLLSTAPTRWFTRWRSSLWWSRSITWLTGTTGASMPLREKGQLQPFQPISQRGQESEQTAQTVHAFLPGGSESKGTPIFTNLYAYASPKVTYEMVDPDRHPELADRFKVSTMGTTRVQYGTGEKFPTTGPTSPELSLKRT